MTISTSYTPKATTTSPGVASFDEYDFNVAAGVVSLRPGSAVYFVGKWGDDAADGLTYSSAKLTVQAAVTAAPANSTILVHPGTYTETVTLDANNTVIHGVGRPTVIIIEQADANVIDFNSRTGSVLSNVQVRVTAATSAIAAITGSTGSLKARDCQLRMTSTADIASASQPSIVNVTGAGTFKLRFSQFHYTNSGNGGATAQKAPFVVGTGGTIDLKLACCSTITTAGTELATAIAVDVAATGIIKMADSDIEITGTGNLVAGLAYLGGTGATHEFYRNRIEIDATGCANAYGFFAADTATTSRFFYNHIHVENATNNYSFYVGTGSTVISHFDDIIADDGISGAGTFQTVSSLSDGNFEVTGTIAHDATPATDLSASGTIVQLVASETQAFGDACRIDTDGEAHIADASVIATSSAVVICADATVSAGATGNYLISGICRQDAWTWTVGGLVYLTITGTTTNTLSQTKPSGSSEVVQILGVATHADRMLWTPSLVQVELA